MTAIDSFEALPLAAPLQRVLRENGYTQPSPIQAAAIPHLLEGTDLLGSAQTGTGKTAAFALPILHRMQASPRRLESRRTRALVLTPTRELAVQVAKSFETYGRYLRLSVTQVYGGVPAGPQIRALRRGTDVLVATPGRLLDHYEQGRIDFSSIEFFVLDEADRMLDMGFIHDIRKVVRELPAERQSLFLSATLSSEITRLAADILTDPVDIRMAPEKTTAENIDHRICFLRHDDKMTLLHNLLKTQGTKEGTHLTLVFSRTKHGADRLVKSLDRKGIGAVAIHGNKAQGARQRALEQFRRGAKPILVATDVAARGIDVKDVTLVVNYDLPDEAEAYVHRIGRTARAGAAGRALSFCTDRDLGELHAIEKLLKAEIPVEVDHGYHIEGLASRRRPLGSSGGGIPRGPKRRGGSGNNKRGNFRRGRRGGNSQRRGASATTGRRR